MEPGIQIRALAHRNDRIFGRSGEETVVQRRLEIEAAAPVVEESTDVTSERSVQSSTELRLLGGTTGPEVFTQPGDVCIDRRAPALHQRAPLPPEGVASDRPFNCETPTRRMNPLPARKSSEESSKDAFIDSVRLDRRALMENMEPQFVSAPGRAVRAPGRQHLEGVPTAQHEASIGAHSRD